MPNAQPLTTPDEAHAQRAHLPLSPGLEWRCIGPYRGGRVVAVAGDPVDAAVFYFGACAGGVWKTTDGGTYWENISDGFFQTAAVGALAVSDADPNVIYAGMGECCIRGNVSHGDGVYKSTDAGRSWTHMGLQDTRHLARVRIHPHNPDLVYVAALGHVYGPNMQRGVFRSADGGKTWDHILFRSDRAGAIDLSMDPGNPRLLYAAIWDAHRTPWSLTSGGPDSGMYRSTDGGDTWTELTASPGLPTGLKGRIGVAVSPAKAGRVWALVEAEDGGLFRSDDAGATWQRLSDDRNLQLRFWYYGHVFADPHDPDTVYVLNIQAWKSTDGGRTFTQLTTPHGDNHDLWIDPRRPQRMIEGNDGGACVSFNGGASWSTIYNQPTAQFYHVAADTHFPYRLYGTQQDNSAICVPSRSDRGAILSGECYFVGSSESGYIAVRPDNPDVVYSGAIGSAPGGGGVLLRYDHHTGQVRIITVWPEVYGGWGAKDLKYRFQWTYPIVLSPHDPNILYVAGNVLFRSTDEGMSWEAISPDLTRNDVAKLEPSGGPITRDTTGAEHYCTIFAFVESPHERGVFWAGSDDGLLHLSRDGGRTWDDVTPKELPDWTLISMIEVSPHDPATAYVAATRYKFDDPLPYLFKTADYGKSWRKITDGIPAHDFTRVIREDPGRPGLLYAGTETGVYVSFDGGGSWRSLRLNLPAVPVYDLLVKDQDLVAATHGRSFWILDDLTPLQQMAERAPDGAAHLFTPRPTLRLPPPMGIGRQPGPGKNYMLALGVPATYYETPNPYGQTRRTFLDAGKNPPDGVIVTYYLRDKPAEEVTLDFYDASGQLVRHFTSRQAENASHSMGPQEPRVPTDSGLNRFVWNLRYPEARGVPGDATTERNLNGPLAPPGKYQVRLSVGADTYTAAFALRKDPRVSATTADFEAQFSLLLRIRDKLSDTHEAINRLRNIRQQAETWKRRVDGLDVGESVATAMFQAVSGLQDKLVAIEEALIQTKARVQQDQLNLPTRLNAKLAALSSVVSSADGAPTRQAYDVFHDLSSRIDQQLLQLQEVIDTDVAALNALIRRSDIPAILP
jgi:photosystem II stability/assembly factor-like uncharacterized protein